MGRCTSSRGWQVFSFIYWCIFLFLGWAHWVENENRSESASQTAQILASHQSEMVQSPSNQAKQYFAKPNAMKRKKVQSLRWGGRHIATFYNAWFDVYGEHVAMKLKSYSRRSQASQHYVNNILFEADMGRYEAPPVSYHQNQTISPTYSAPPSPATFSSTDSSGSPSPAFVSRPNNQHVEPQLPTTNHSHQLSTEDANPLVAVIASDPETFFFFFCLTFPRSIYSILPFNYSHIITTYFIITIATYYKYFFQIYISKNKI